MARTRELRAEDVDDRTRLHVEVSDTGIGLEGLDVEKLFESFAQGDASTTRMHGGTGLGLAISREIVGAFGGRIGARNYFVFSNSISPTRAIPLPRSINTAAIFRVSSGVTKLGVARAARRSPTAKPSAVASSSSVPVKSRAALVKSSAI